MRLFVAAEVPEKHLLSIEEAIQPLRSALPKARWIPRDNWHITLKFLGQVEDHRLEEMTKVAGKAAVFCEATETKLTEIGAFPNSRRPRVLWVGLDDASGGLAKLAAELDRRYAKRGFAKEGRKYNAHLTIARFRTPVELEPHLATPFEFEESAFGVKELVLFQSHLSSKGARYEAVGRFSLE